MQRVFLIAVPALIMLAIGSIVSWSVVYGDKAKDSRAVLKPWDTRRLAAIRAKENAEGALAVVDEETFDFGVQDPYTTGNHVFTIRNDGKKPLELKFETISCDCLKVKVLTPEVAPGAEGKVALAWKVAGRTPRFFKFFMIRTNDPGNELLKINIVGKVRGMLSSSHDEVHMGRLWHGEPGRAKFAVYTQRWQHFDIVDATCDIEHASWQISPLDEEQLRVHDAECGYLVDFEISKDMPDDLFSGIFKITIVNDQQEEHGFEMPISGRYRRSIAVYGEHIGDDGELQAGTRRYGEGFRTTCLIKVRGEHRKISFPQIECKPDFVKAEISPLAHEGNYLLTVEIPRDAPVGTYGKDDETAIRITTDHPRHKVLTLKPAFIIVKP